MFDNAISHPNRRVSVIIFLIFEKMCKIVHALNVFIVIRTDIIQSSILFGVLIITLFIKLLEILMKISFTSSINY